MLPFGARTRTMEQLFGAAIKQLLRWAPRDAMLCEVSKMTLGASFLSQADKHKPHMP